VLFLVWPLSMWFYPLTRNRVEDIQSRLRDIGISAFKGKNATEGALKIFIELVEAGRIEKGSTLILESLDIMVRQAPLV